MQISSPASLRYFSIVRNSTRLPLAALACLGVIAAIAMSALAFADDKPADVRLGQIRVGKVLFLGNSITLHPPSEKIGWTGNYGMAASAADKDYVHLLLASLADATYAKSQSMVRNIADFERKPADYNVAERLKPELEFQADLVIVAIGENVAALKTPELKEQFRLAFANLLAEVKKHGQPTIIVRSTFWADGAKDEIMQRESVAAGAAWVDISALGKVEANYARAERAIKHAGVGAHPGDQGMQAIADAIWKAIRERSRTKTE